jgi:hypothetical protein
LLLQTNVLNVTVPLQREVHNVVPKTILYTISKC